MNTKRLIKRIDSYRIPIREKLNPILGGGVRLMCVKDKEFTIFSNNCWGGHVYRYFHLPYLSPTVGLYFYAPEYVRFVSNARHYCQTSLDFIEPEKSKYYDMLKEQHNTYAPIGVLGGDVEVVFLHYKSQEEAYTKWTRRCERINWDNVILKFSEQNGATLEHLKAVDALPYDKKLIFTAHDYGLKSQVLFKEYEGYPQIPDETTHFRRYVNLIRLVNGEPYIR